MAPRSENSAENLCKKCGKEVKICVKCFKCAYKYHPSCILKIHGIYVDKENVVCCDDITSKHKEKELEIEKLKKRLSYLNELSFENSISQLGIVETGTSGLYEDCSDTVSKNGIITEVFSETNNNKDVEIKYKNELLLEKSNMIEELQDKIKVLNKYINLLEKLEENRTSLTPSKKEISNITGTANLSINRLHVVTSETDVCVDNVLKKKSLLPNESTIETVLRKEENCNTKSRKLQIGTDKDNRKHEMKKKQETLLGSDRGTYKLKAADRKAWLYVGRVEKKCTAEDLLEFLNNKLPDKKFEIDKISSDDSPTSSFRVSLEFELLEKLNQEKFWPQGIKIKRYHFFRDQRRYSKSPGQQIQTTQH